MRDFETKYGNFTKFFYSACHGLSLNILESVSSNHKIKIIQWLNQSFLNQNQHQFIRFSSLSVLIFCDSIDFILKRENLYELDLGIFQLMKSIIENQSPVYD